MITVENYSLNYQIHQNRQMHVESTPCKKSCPYPRLPFFSESCFVYSSDDNENSGKELYKLVFKKIQEFLIHKIENLDPLNKDHDIIFATEEIFLKLLSDEANIKLTSKQYKKVIEVSLRGDAEFLFERRSLFSCFYVPHIEFLSDLFGSSSNAERIHSKTSIIYVSKYCLKFGEGKYN